MTPRIAARSLLALAALLALPACGRVGPVRAKGPRSEIVYPRAYPYTPPARAAAPDTPSTSAPASTGELPLDRPGLTR